MGLTQKKAVILLYSVSLTLGVVALSFFQRIDELVELAHRQDIQGIKSILKEIIPEYQPYEIHDER